MATETDDGELDGYVPVADHEELEAEGRKLVTPAGTAIALFHHEGEIRAVDNRCPHMGFPLADGTVDDGILTCHWHHARFELSCGDTFDPWADDVRTYPVAVRQGTVYVDPDPPLEKSPDDHWASRLETGLEENLRLVIAKSTIGLLDAGVDDREPVTSALKFGTRYREGGWGSGLTILGCATNLLEALDGADRKRALYTGVRHVATDSAGQTPRFDQPPFSTDAVETDRLERWFRDCIEVRDADGAERCLRTAIERDGSPDRVAGMVFAAATDHPYLSTGHVLDFANKAFEILECVGWAAAGVTLASLVEPLATAARSDERSSWRQPVDLVALCEEVYGGDVRETSGLESLLERGAGSSWTEPEDFRETLLADDPEAIVDGLVEAVQNGATSEQLARSVTRAAAIRVAQFATANEFTDWNTVHHTFTYANAVHQATRRTDHVALYRGVFDAAMNVYLDRFLNSPPAPVPDPGDHDTGREPDSVLEGLSETFDREGAVNEAGRLVGEFFDCGGDASDLKRTLGHALFREDAGFHTIQNVEAAFAQHDLADDDGARRIPLIATARYLAAHTPTRREAEQTFSIAVRLNRGETIHAQ